MTCDKHEPNDPPRCREIATDRNRYYFGKTLRPEHFRLEQDYFLSRHQLHNRLLHGWGIVCGLDVIGNPHYFFPQPAARQSDATDEVEHEAARADAERAKRANPARDEWARFLEAHPCVIDPCDPPLLIVKPGVALDSCGRELIVKRPIPVPVPAGWKAGHPELDGGEQPAEGKAPTSFDPIRLLYLYYDEEEFEQTAALCPDRTSGSTLEHNLIRELARVGWMPWRDEEHDYPDCWHQSSTPWPDSDVCLCPDDACPSHRVPLAMVTAHEETDPETSEKRVVFDSLDTSGRRDLSGPRLTTVTPGNWEHGGQLALQPDGRLKVEVQFSSKLADFTALTTDIFTVVARECIRRGREELFEEIILPPDPTAPHHGLVLSEDRTRATYTIARNVIDNLDLDYLRPLYIRLNCDFLVDCNGLTVDGSFMAASQIHNGVLKPRWRSGNGTPGGVFYSWFTVVKPNYVRW